MTKTDLGSKRHCPSCAARFYDLGKNPAACPKCGTLHDSTVQVKAKRGKAKPAAKEAAKEKPKLAAKPQIKEIEGVDLEEFEDIETLDTQEEIEELEEIEDIESIEDLQEVESETGSEDEDMILEDSDEDPLIDEVEEEAVEEEEAEAPKGKKKK